MKTFKDITKELLSEDRGRQNSIVHNDPTKSSQFHNNMMRYHSDQADALDGYLGRVETNRFANEQMALNPKEMDKFHKDMQTIFDFHTSWAQRHRDLLHNKG